MSLFSSIRDRFSRKGVRVLRLGGQLGLTPGAPMQLSVVYACVGVLAKAMAMMPLEPYRRDRCGHSSVAPEHPLYRLLALAPNGVVSRYTLMELMVQSMLLRGNAYAYIERDRAGLCELEERHGELPYRHGRAASLPPETKMISARL